MSCVFQEANYILGNQKKKKIAFWYYIYAFGNPNG